MLSVREHFPALSPALMEEKSTDIRDYPFRIVRETRETPQVKKIRALWIPEAFRMLSTAFGVQRNKTSHSGSTYVILRDRSRELD